MNISIYDIIDELQLDVGETRRITCPSCHGYKTFTVTNNMGQILWNCYKSSCKVSGAKKVRVTIEDIKNRLMPQREHKEDTFEMPEYVVFGGMRPEVQSFAYEWGIDCDYLHYDVKERRVVFPVKSRGMIVDAVGRSLGFRLPKWKRYGKSDLPFTYGCGKIAVVVEDCVSASVVGNDVYLGVAVLGTSLSESHKKYLAQFSMAIIALDPDALPKTLSIAKDLRDVVDTVKVLRLQDDLKYRNEEDFINLNKLTPKE
tara:strand:+ start:1583 stop:2353 length:771 start_codon:yes stop_codon:yes gene_type:complete